MYSLSKKSLHFEKIKKKILQQCVDFKQNVLIFKHNFINYICFVNIINKKMYNNENILM